MKRIGMITMALAMLVALTQCKKEEQAASGNGSDTVTITLNLKINAGTRADVNTSTGEVTYEPGDMVYVASGGHYIGTLTYNGTNFSGGITDPIVGEPLHFYHLGNVEPAETLAAGITTTCSVVISDQTEHLPVIEYAPSNENYDSGETTYTAMLFNKCALVKFNVTTASEAATCITGMKNMVTVDFAENTLTHSQEGAGLIKLTAGSGERWAILLPQAALEEGEEGSAYSESGLYTGTRGAVPAIVENGYITAGIAVNVTTEGGNPSGNPEGAINGLFTINANGDQVRFSQGNLQYTKSTGVWSFMEHQYDWVETHGQDVGTDYANQDIVSLFGWGTSGYDHGAVCYQPWSTSTSSSDYYAYGNWQYNLYDQTGMADWGYNAISNGGNTENSGWRTLTQPEWNYVFNTRSTTSGIRYAKATVNNVNGVVLLPDNWTESIYALNNTNSSDADFTSNTITATDWTNTLEANGAVFLPAAGGRYGTSALVAGSDGNYWSSSCSNSTCAWGVLFGSGGLDTSYDGGRLGGLSVRLVRSAQ